MAGFRLSKTNLGCSLSSSKSKHWLHSNIEPRNVKGLEHYFASVLAALWRGEWAFSQKKVVILGITSQVIKYALLPEPLHGVLILNVTSKTHFSISSTKSTSIEDVDGARLGQNLRSWELLGAIVDD